MKTHGNGQELRLARLWACALLSGASLGFGCGFRSRETELRAARVARGARAYNLLETKEAELERAALTRPVQREVAASVFNPLLDELNGIPRLDKVRPEHLVGAVDIVLEQFQSDVTRIQDNLYQKSLKQQRLSYEEVLGPLEVALDRLEKVWGAMTLLRRAWRISPKIDEIYHLTSYRMSTAASILAQSDLLHEALWRLSQEDLSEPQRRVVQRLTREGYLMGVGMDDAKALRSLEEGVKRLGQLGAIFAENLASEAPDALKSEALGASQAEHPEKAFVASRLGLGRGNLGVIAEMLQHRQAWAASLGYETFADLVFESRTASKAEVEAFLGVLRQASEEAAVAEIKDLELVGAHMRDLPRTAEEEPQLTLPTALRGLFRLLERLFGVKMEPATARNEVPIWHRSIRFYRVIDIKTQHPIAGLYLDLFQHGKKLSSGFWADSLVGHSRVLGKNNVARRPVAHIVGDLPPKDTLLSLEQVRSLFAAAGTAMQHLLNLQDGLAGPAALELDASAAPELMALWASDPETWRESEASAALAATPKLRALELFQRVSWAQLDLDLHSQKEAPSEQMLLELARRRLSSEQLAAVLPDFNEDVEGGLGSFRGPFSSGFALGEYVPLWKEVLAADLFEAFQGMDASEGQRFREALLAPGAGRAPLSAFRDFRRRGPKVAPLLTRLGLKRK
ncbi:unnamed protein product, partial [Effrenium voratum]